MTETLRVVPNQRTDFVSEVTLTKADASLLLKSVVARTTGTIVGASGEACEYTLKGLLGGAADAVVRPGSTYLLHGGANVLSEWVCTLNPLTALSGEIGGTAKKYAETTMVTWFGSRFLVPSGGIGTLNGLFPPPFVLFFDGDYYGAVLDALSRRPSALVEGARLTVELYEVSWLQEEGAFTGVPTVPSAYFVFSITPPGGTTIEHKVLIEGGYDPVAWLSPPPSEILGEIARAREERIRIRRSQASNSPARTADSRTLAVAAEVRPGDYLYLDAGTSGEELAEVWSVGAEEGGSREVLLSRPLRFDHAADGEVLLVAATAWRRRRVRPS